MNLDQNSAVCFHLRKLIKDRSHNIITLIEVMTHFEQGTTFGLDLGTSGIKGLVIDGRGTILASDYREHPTLSDQPGRAEQYPLVWWQNIVDITRVLISQVDPRNIEGVGLSGQMHGLVTYDEDGGVIKRAIIWQDGRSERQVQEINGRFGEPALYKITGLPMSTGFLLPSLLWIMEEHPDLYQRIAKVSSPKDFLAQMLTGVLRSEPTDAQATGAYDYQKDDWSREIIEGVGLPVGIFPEIRKTSEPYGYTNQAAEAMGLPKGIPVFGGSDQSMSAMGTGLIREGQASIAISTGGQFLVIAPKGKLDSKRRLHNLNHALPEIGLYMAATLSAGYSLKWLRNMFGKKDLSYDEFLSGVENIPAGSEGLIFLPFLVGERTPYRNPNLRGGFFGLSDRHTKLHLARAVLEGVAYSMRDCLKIFRELNIPIDDVILSGGGSKNPVWRQIITDVIGIPIRTINIADHSPFGAAVFARFAQEGLEKLSEFYDRAIEQADKLNPKRENEAKYEKLFDRYKQLAGYANSLPP
ncbi:xylulokinase [Candidatus Roizmanbacteria bacterium]|nr:xylulokinase [Candidatus Roizmanbacteria bacterium]